LEYLDAIAEKSIKLSLGSSSLKTLSLDKWKIKHKI
jgi:hypothetical protein